MINTEIIKELENALSETTALLAGFSHKELNKVPFKGSWTAGQVGCHLLKSETGMDDLLYAPSAPADRNPDQQVQELKDIFLDFSKKFESPDFIIPEDREYTNEELINSLNRVKENILLAAKNSDLTEIAPLPDGHPFVGNTKLEMVHFVTYHTIRHNKQIKKIREAV